MDNSTHTFQDKTYIFCFADQLYIYYKDSATFVKRVIWMYDQRERVINIAVGKFYWHPAFQTDIIMLWTTLGKANEDCNSIKTNKSPAENYKFKSPAVIKIWTPNQ